MTMPSILAATWSDGLFVFAPETRRQELAGHSVRSMAPEQDGGALAIVDGHSLCRRTCEGAWSTIVALLVGTANLESPRWWLTLPGWLTLATCIAIRFESIPQESPYRQAVYLMGLPVLFYFGLWTGAFRNLLKLLFEPPGGHLYAFLTTRSFLVLVILYLGCVCIFYGMTIQKLRDQLKRLERGFTQDAALVAQEVRVDKCYQPPLLGWIPILHEEKTIRAKLSRKCVAKAFPACDEYRG